MSLLGNQSLINNIGVRFIGGSAFGYLAGGYYRSSWNQPSMQRAMMLGQTFPKVAAVPSGYGTDGWIMPMRAGEMGSRFEIEGAGDLAAAIIGGVNGESAIAGSSTLTAIGQLIASALANLSGSSALTATVVGKLEAFAALAGSSNVTAAIGALADLVIAITGTGTLTATARATGTMGAVITPFTELSPESLGAAVWDVLLAQHQIPGSAGEYLSSAGGGSSPSAIAAAVIGADVEGNISLAEALRLLLAVLTGKVSGAGTGTETFRNLADTRDRVVATVDVDGNRTVIVRDVDDP